MTSLMNNIAWHFIYWHHNDDSIFHALLLLFVGNQLVTGGFPSQRTSNAKRWWLFVQSLTKLLNTVKWPVKWDALTLQWCHSKDYQIDGNHLCWLTLVEFVCVFLCFFFLFVLFLLLLFSFFNTLAFSQIFLYSQKYFYLTAFIDKFIFCESLIHVHEGVGHILLVRSAV